MHLGNLIAIIIINITVFIELKKIQFSNSMSIITIAINRWMKYTRDITWYEAKLNNQNAKNLWSPFSPTDFYFMARGRQNPSSGSTSSLNLHQE